MNILDLFAGVGGERRRAKIESMGHKYITVDNVPDFGCSLNWRYTKLIPGDFNVLVSGGYDFVWASPPCTAFSVASIGKHWEPGHIPATEDAVMGMRLILKTIHVIRMLNPQAWIIENPRGMLRKLGLMNNFRRWTVTYCQYGDKRMKPTDLWGVVPGWHPRPMCKNGDTCHEPAPRGSRTGTQGLPSASERAVVPWDLWEEILISLQEHIVENGGM